MLTPEEVREHAREAKRRWYHRNREHAITKVAEWKRLHPEQVKAQGKRWRQSAKGIAHRRAYEKKYYYEGDGKRQDRDKWLRNQYGIGVDAYQKLFEEQKGLCAICESPSSKSVIRTENLDVDHDHKKNLVRGLLCRRCNLMLGPTFENPRAVHNLVAYLQRVEER